MELKKWTVFKHVDSHFAADVKRAYLIGITSSEDSNNYIENEGTAIFEFSDVIYPSNYRNLNTKLLI